MIRVRLAAFSALSHASVAAVRIVILCGIGISVVGAESSPGSDLSSYRAHLKSLQAIVAACRQQRSSEACDASSVGSDDKVTFSSGGAAVEREIRYDWLRALMTRAASKTDETSTSPVSIPIAPSKAPSVDDLLKQAEARLAADAQQGDSEETRARNYETEKTAISAILARPEYKLITKTSIRQQMLNRLMIWLNRIFDRLVGLGTRVPWLASAARDVFIALACLALVWVLIRIERRARIRLADGLDQPAGAAPSAREWQSWLADARNMAAQSAWREAIHFLYWAVISRLESRHVWIADRARTPREYLRLVPSNDARREHLAALTRSFERTWYGGRSASPSDYDSALKVAGELGVK